MRSVYLRYLVSYIVGGVRTEGVPFEYLSAQTHGDMKWGARSNQVFCLLLKDDPVDTGEKAFRVALPDHPSFKKCRFRAVGLASNALADFSSKFCM